MKGKLTLLLLLFCSSPAFAQFGFTGKYWMTNKNWDWDYSDFVDLGEPEDLTPAGWSIGVDYWFRLKNKRVEFLPELNIAGFGNNYDIGLESNAKVYSFFFNVNLYLWDLSGDCDCPTFSKQGPTLAKGLFVQLSPGLSYWDMKFGPTDSAPNVIEGQNTTFNLGGGLGFDIGLNDLITITPVVNLRYYPKMQFSNRLTYLDVNESPIEGNVSVSSSPLFWNAGLRLGLRLDQ